MEGGSPSLSRLLVEGRSGTESTYAKTDPASFSSREASVTKTANQKAGAFSFVTRPLSIPSLFPFHVCSSSPISASRRELSPL